MTVEQAHEFFSSIPIIERKLKTLLDVGLGYIKLGQNATTLSGGEAQRVKLALELSKRDTGKTLYILDEPTTGLDPNQIVEIRSLIRSIGTDRTVLFSTHIMQEVEQLCDRVIVLNKGTIVADEGIAQLKKRGASLEAVFQQLTSSAG